LRFGDARDIRSAGKLVEDLGFTAIWVPGAFGGPVFETVELLLDSTDHIVVATGIVNIWAHTSDEVAASYAQLNTKHSNRFLLGLGSSHPEFAPAMGIENYGKPFTKMREYLDALDSAAVPVPAAGRALAALGPKMRSLAVERAAGIHSYFVTPAHTKMAREQAGPNALLAVEHAVVLEESPEIAREIARCYTGAYLALPNYTRNLEKFGYVAEDFAGGGSDRLVDDLVAWGSPEQIRDRLEGHLRAGANHVCAQVITPGWDPQKIVAGEGVLQPVDEWRKLADVATSLNGQDVALIGREA
jgi:probable F420-dependent oxidoreductase